MPPIGALLLFCRWLSLHLDSSIKGSASSSKSQIIAMMDSQVIMGHDSCLSAHSHDDSRCHTCRMRLAYWIIHLQTTILLEMQNDDLEWGDTRLGQVQKGAKLWRRSLDLLPRMRILLENWRKDQREMLVLGFQDRMLWDLDGHMLTPQHGHWL